MFYHELGCVSLNELSKYDGYQIKNKSQFIYFIFKYRFLIVYVVTADNLLNCDTLLQLGSGQYANESMVPFFVFPSPPPNFISFTLLCFPLTSSQSCGYLGSNTTVYRVV